MKSIIILIALFVYIISLTACAYANDDFNYPDNFRHSREMILDEGHYKVIDDADRAAYRYFFKRGEKFKIRTHPVKTPKKKRKFKEKMNLWEIVEDRLQPKNIFDFYPLTSQLNTPQRILTAVSIGYLMDNDRDVYKNIESGMRTSKFWKNNGPWLSTVADGLTEVGVAGVLSLTGNKKNQQVAQMLMESALSLRIVYIKRVLGVTRPSELVSNIGCSHCYDSFPSGHTAVAFSMATILGESYDIKWITYPLAILSGLSRIQQNTHWASDVLAGGLLGHLEAREILYRHGYIPSAKIAESHNWDNTRVDIDGGYRIYYDSYSNMESNDKILDRVGRLLWSWRITQKLSDYLLLQVNYHWRGQIPSIASYNSSEDILVNPRLAVKLGNGMSAIFGYTFNRIQFNDLGKSPHHPDVSQLPPGLNYIGNYDKNSSKFGFMFKLSKDLMLKPQYTYSTHTYGSYHNLDSHGSHTSIKLETSPERERKTDFCVKFTSGYEKPCEGRYSFKNGKIEARVSHKLGEKWALKGSYITDKRNYWKWPGDDYAPTATWDYYGVEVSRKFTDSWNGELGYYKRKLSSDIPGWAYKKNLYFLQLNNRF